MKPIPVLLVTYNRLEYTKKAIESIIRNPGLPVSLSIWDNGSTDGTIDWLKEWIGSPWRKDVCRIGSGLKNVGLAPAMNWFFRENAGEDYVVKVDNDTVLPDNWLADLMEVMERNGKSFGRIRKISSGVEIREPEQLGAVSGTCLRPPGLTAADWYDKMVNLPFNNHRLYFNPACLGTGVLINMDMIRQRGLLFEKFPRSPESGPDDPCLISGWGAYIQEASAFEGWRFAMYSKVPVKLLNLKEDQVLSNDYPEYDAEVAKVREEGNRWWASVGGIEGVRKYVQEHGGLEPLPGHEALRSLYWHGQAPVFKLHSLQPLPWELKFDSAKSEMAETLAAHDVKLLTQTDNLALRATREFWHQRVEANGPTKSAFLTTSQTRINEFTEKHVPILQHELSGKDVLEVGCGIGRMSWQIAQIAKTYIGTDFIQELIDTAQENLPSLSFNQASADNLPFTDESFDVVVGVAVLSSFAGNFTKILSELKRVLRPEGRILFLEEDFVRIDWKMKT